MYIEFVQDNFLLFGGLLVVLYMLALGPITQAIYKIQAVSGQQAVSLINRKSAIIVDVCEAKDFNIGHLPNAINIPLATLADRARELDKHKEKSVLVSCRSGNRSLKGAVALKKKGFTSVYMLTGGLLAWQKDNLPVER